MKNINLNVKKKQKGFTLIELVVVIVIIGILAATAVPRFGNLTTQANTAVAQGISGALLSSAVIQFGVNQGSTTLASIIANTDSTEAFTLDVGTCNAGGGADTAYILTVTASGATANGTLLNSLCNN